jgi:hypothetical protein
MQEVVPVPHNFFPNIDAEGIFLYLLYETSIILIPKPKK